MVYSIKRLFIVTKTDVNILLLFKISFVYGETNRKKYFDIMTKSDI